MSVFYSPSMKHDSTGYVLYVNTNTVNIYEQILYQITQRICLLVFDNLSFTFSSIFNVQNLDNFT